MEIGGTLAIFAEVGLGLAGFSGITVAFTRPARPRFRPLEAYRLALLFSTSLGAAGLALLALTLGHSGLPGTIAWRVATGAAALASGTMIVAFYRPTRRFLRPHPEIFHGSVLAIVTVGHLLNAALQGAVAVAGPSAATLRAAFLWGLLWLLAHSALQFSRILFVGRPRGVGRAARSRGFFDGDDAPS